MALPFAGLSFPEMYEQALVGPLFHPWAERLLDDVELAAGDCVLDVACGTGILARLAKERLGESIRVVGVDLNPAMLAVARQVAPGVDWREGDVAALPLHKSERFDVVVCQQGIQFFSNRTAAARQMRGALAAGGRLAVSAWRADEELSVLRELRRVVERYLGPIIDRRHSFGETAPLEALLREAGFHDVRSKTVSRTIRFDDGAVWVHMNAIALVGMSGAAKAMGEAERERVMAAIARDSVEVVRPYTDEAGLAFELRANVATARG
ncbi:methyltransferase domain-containing protein [Trichocoleus sp. FACHB-591]|uniref:class I SAM-dependent methyltransferase n=1 Tax=Trichocoleus sp. FACHB-591 TaxID=2692872 RepID=UPI001683B39B|nr:methyltransferase domain-containing protein [Trichocoleus sp. FACHB-591]MBD2094284.1 methyltransferase domain-containing protein [Trichocoleus sp. FACHB-591]